jgi:hypothetical protein
MDNKKIVLDHALQQLQKIMTDLKNGKTPTFPKSLKKISDVLSVIDDKNIKEKELDNIIDTIAKDITTKK